MLFRKISPIFLDKSGNTNGGNGFSLMGRAGIPSIPGIRYLLDRPDWAEVTSPYPENRIGLNRMETDCSIYLQIQLDILVVSPKI